MSPSDPDDAHAARRGALDAAYEAGFAIWQRAEQVAALTLIDPQGLGGVCLAAQAGPVRTAWLDAFRALGGPSQPYVAMPAGVSEDRLVGGVSIEHSLKTGALVAETGLLARADGGVLLASMAERMEMGAAGLVAAAMDEGAVRVERTGSSRRDPARFAAILLDERVGADEAPPDILLDRLAFHLDLSAVPPRATLPFEIEREDIAAARGRLASIAVPDEITDALIEACAGLGIASLRAPLFCLRAARAAAALEAREVVSVDDAQLACSLVLAGRATHPPPDDAPPPPEDPPPPDDSEEDTSGEEDSSDELPEGALEDILIEAVRAVAMEGALASLAAQASARKAQSAGKVGARSRSAEKGRPDRPRRPLQPGTGRMDLMATLRAAAPWQKLRGKPPGNARLAIRREDLRIKRFRHRAESSVIFVVDASGSSALNRMAEAKGAVELLLSDCYARRDQVSLIALRGEAGELVLPPTRALVRVRRSLAGLPSGGTTPLASGIAMAAELAEAESARGRTPFLVFLSDGRGNVALDGSTDRDAASEDTHKAARRLKALGHASLFFDTSRRPSERAGRLAGDLGAQYRPLPFADGRVVSRSVREAIGYR